MRRDLVVVGASAGGVEALQALVAGLPADLPATVLVVLHVPTYGISALPAILTRSGPLPARHLTQVDHPRHGEIIIAPPDHHLVVRDGSVALSRGPRENGHRPAVDVLFRTAARAVGARVIGVVLSGVMDDGTAGLQAIKDRGGLALVQDPEDALYAGMPDSAIAHVPIDSVVPAKELGALIAQLCAVELTGTSPDASALVEMEADLAMMDGEAMNDNDRPGEPSGYSCPDCGGTLFGIPDGNLERFRCRVGHAWSAESLLGEQSLQMESALWMALRSLEEKAALSRELAERALARGSTLSAGRFQDQADEALRAADLVRTMLRSDGAEIVRRHASGRT